jgi:predicted  nucleic acid-binding Zn-ribbon protein
MGANSVSQLEAEEAGLNLVVERARIELEKANALKILLKSNIEKLKKGVARLEARGSRVITLIEYKRMRQEVVQLYKELANCELDLRGKNENLRLLCQDLKSIQESLSSLRKRRPTR